MQAFNAQCAPVIRFALNRRVRTLLLLWIALLCGETRAFATGDADRNPCQEKYLPQEVQRVLHRSFPLFRILNLEDLTSDDRRFWLNSEKKSGCPGWTSGTYRGGREPSYVLSLVTRESHPAASRLVHIYRDIKGALSSEVLEQDEPSGFPRVVYTVPPGEYWNDDRTRSVRITREGFQTEQKESGAFLYYWDGNAMLRWTISQ